MAPALPTPQRNTPVSGVRGRPFGESPLTTTPLNPDERVVSLADAASMIERLGVEYDNASVTNEKQMGDLADFMTEVHNFRRTQLVGLKEAARDLLDAVAEAKAVARPPASREEHDDAVIAVEKKKALVIDEILRERQEISKLRSTKEAIVGSASETAMKEKDLRDYLKQSIPVLEAKQKFYLMISNTKLYPGNGIDGDDVITGYVGDKSANEVHPFTFDLNRMSCYDAVNALWGRILSAHSVQR